MMTALFIIAAIGILLFREQINSYIGYPAAGYAILMLGVTLLGNAISAILNGQHLVHVAGILSPVNSGSRAGAQIAAITAGLGLAGMLGGYVIGYLVFIIIGSFVAVRSLPVLRLPQRRHIQRILSFAKYAWLGGLKGKAFNWVDIALLGALVSTSLVGYYTAAWNIAQFLAIFSAAISQTIFPKMSETVADDDPEAVADLLNTALSFSGLIMIPGIVGSILLGGNILAIYGSDFRQAGVVLSILIGATLLQSYQKQLTTTLNALDRPDAAFQVNLVFIISNVILNIVFILVYGWVGAAIATAASVAVSLALAYYYVDILLEFRFPISEVVKQWVAAGIMGVTLILLLQFRSEYLSIGDHIAVGLSFIPVGAMIYFGVLLILSAQFRMTVRNNMPAKLLE
jgi:O-antigen/teichoic acid export membrane protein